jgi:hypothetical protein
MDQRVYRRIEHQHVFPPLMFHSLFVFRVLQYLVRRDVQRGISEGVNDERLRGGRRQGVKG